MSSEGEVSPAHVNSQQCQESSHLQTTTRLNQAVSQSTGDLSAPVRLTRSGPALTALNHRNVPPRVPRVATVLLQSVHMTPELAVTCSKMQPKHKLEGERTMQHTVTKTLILIKTEELTSHARYILGLYVDVELKHTRKRMEICSYSICPGHERLQRF